MKKNQEVKVEYFKNGKIKSKEHLKNGTRHGLTSSWYQNGSLRHNGQFNEGNIHGIWTGWHENGTKAWETVHKDGIQHGIQTYFGEVELDCCTKCELYYIDGNLENVAMHYKNKEPNITTDPETCKWIANAMNHVKKGAKNFQIFGPSKN
jgi:antitoxin component YwqK of YwqJK toxin-antitoxin module